MSSAQTGYPSPRPAGPGIQAPPAPRPATVRRQGRVLAALLGALFLGNVDVAIANIAGPAIRSGLHASGGELELIVSGYTLAYAVLLVTGARLGEARGYRPVFLAGLGGFTLASLACGLAPTATLLVAARVAAGAAAALMVAQVLTGIQVSFAGKARERAIGLYALVLSAGAVAGQSLGGLLITANVLGATWRPAFLVNVPIGVALVALSWRNLPASARAPRTPGATAGPGRGRRLDPAGVAVLSAAVLLLTVPLVLGRDAGWPAWSLACLAASVPAFGLLWKVEAGVSARGGRPLVDPRLLARPVIGWGLAAQSAATGTYFAILFTLALYLQQGLGKSAAYSGLALVSWVAAFGVPGPLLGRCPARVRALAAPGGALLLAAGYAGLAAALYAGNTSGVLLMVLLGVAGLGLGATFAGTLSQLTGAVTSAHAADLSGLFNTSTRVGGVIGTAAAGTAYLALVHRPAQAVPGFALLCTALAVTALCAAAMAALSVRRRPAG